LEFCFRFWSPPLRVISMSFCITLPNFVQIGAPIAEIWRHIHFSRWRARPLNTTSGFVFVDVTAYQQTKFRRDNSICGWDITTSGFEIQTSAILEFYFRFRFRPVRRNLHVILHQAAEFRPNRRTHCAVKIWRHIYFSIWRPRPLNTTSGFVIVDVAAFRRLKSINKPNFVVISPLAAEILTTSGFEIQTSAILEFYFRFRSLPFRRDRPVNLHPAAEFRPNRNIGCWASKHIYLSNDRLPKKPLAQQCWQPIVTAQTVQISSHKEQKTYILATPHRHNITVINAKEQQ